MDRDHLDAGIAMKTQLKSDAGITLIETMIAILVLSVGAAGMAATFLHGMQAVVSSPNELIATQKAAEAVESVFGARDARVVTWDQLRGTNNGGIFLTGPRGVKEPGADGIVNTADDGNVESMKFPGQDQLIDTADDKTETLSRFTREIQITDLTTDLRSITVTITYPAGPRTLTYTLTAYMSQFA